jgi:predicted Zn-dependent protease
MKNALMILIFCCALSAGTGAGLLHAAQESGSPRDLKWLLLQAAEEEKALDRSGLIYDDPDLEHYLERIVRNLQPAELRGDLSFRVRVIKDPHLNAFVFPDGAIYINTGILARIENEAQLATILAHEMAHALMRHALKTLQAFEGKGTAPAAIQERFAKSPERGTVGRLLAPNGPAVSVAAYSSSLEQEADRVGLDLIIKAGYDPREAVDLFRHLEKESMKEGIHEPFISETRPSLRDRMREFERLLHAHRDAEMPGIRNRDIFLLETKRALLENARLDLKLGRFTAALTEAEKYLRISPRDARALYLLGEILRKRGEDGDVRRARIFYEKAISEDPSYPEPYRTLGLVQYKAGEMLLAGKSFQCCLLLSPHRPDRAYIEGYLRECRKREAEKGAGL